MHLAHPALVQKTLENADMKQENPRKTPYNNDVTVSTTNITDIPTAQYRDKYRKLVGDLRYLADSTYPDFAKITGKLGAALNQPAA